MAVDTDPEPAAPGGEAPPGGLRPLLAAPARSRVRTAVGAAVVLVLVGLGATVLTAMLATRGGVVSGGSTGAPAATVDGEGGGALVVHVLGAVAAPGVYELRAGARVLDAVAAAGGLAADAEPAALNLAATVTDGQQLVVPEVGAPTPTGPGAGGAAAGAGDGRVNLNTADETALETLPRVGPAMAERIIRYREANGGFRSVQDLLGVSGIGEKTFAALQPLVTV